MGVWGFAHVPRDLKDPTGGTARAESVAEVGGLKVERWSSGGNEPQCESDNEGQEDDDGCEPRHGRRLGRRSPP